MFNIMKFKINRFTHYTFFYLNRIITRPKHKKLFISTGYFGTLIASILAKNCNNSENYLLITLDRQNQEENLKWAKILNPSWTKIDFINHKEYYEVDEFTFIHKWKDIFFDEVYSNHIENLNLVKKYFYHGKINVHEEGLATYYAYNKNLNSNLYDKIFFLNKNLLKKSSKKINIINSNEFLKTLNLSKKHYHFNPIKKDRNVIYVMPGLQPYEVDSDYLNFHYNNIIKIESEGYNVYVAPHPRVKTIFPKHINVIKNFPIIDIFLIKNKTKISYIYSQYSSLTTYCEIIYDIKPKIINSNIKNKYQQELKKIQDQYLH